MNDPRTEPDPWQSASWAGAEAAILEAGARLSLAERLRWLEQAAAAARALTATADAPGLVSSTRAGAEAERLPDPPRR